LLEQIVPALGCRGRADGERQQAVTTVYTNAFMDVSLSVAQVFSACQTGLKSRPYEC
jgi:hypothetical protein